ncbi:type I-U CRISPR-associated RAMP protein Csb1/Cas7u [Conexibacter stalactiti]|uniref:Type I-U CRISPR-associated RAMP protein Csb1/Cas7u n=1 Tax=Conexibacter stalactiti TaxID=1940611 RepID=A0ABU4HI49_9ACTN|nr:type I-U CRISPR-associated RAMP protein Csb1/Cas7u [Conexibacter stalactiti]MDW5592989.1 type I-U CRISPR-associated RAMP protein Csb1/Cas7u [Conexibacter stalactiti]MEC5033630.1 type I-U CRISPR-associated RAMP protein Csb1/Cas7u [Conexibacter stalactiti]
MTVDLLSALRDGLSDEPSATRPAGIEVRQDLEPAGGLPVQPPSYEGRLEIHDRYIDGEPCRTIELDSVGSAANRLEEVLLALHRAGRYPLPVSSTTVEPSDGEAITITTLEMPHRSFDAWLRLSEPVGGGGRFDASERGLELSLAHAAALDPLLETSSHDLLFGVWDSQKKGPHGQVRIGRALTSSLIGLKPIEQAQFAARRDPLNLGEASDLPRGARRLSEQGLSSIPPQQQIPYDHEPARTAGKIPVGFRGGVVITEARYLGFLSFAALRRLSFAHYDNTETRVLLAALGLYALTLRGAAGWDLRARCALVPRAEMCFDLVGADGRRERFALAPDAARSLLDDAVARVGVADRSVHLRAGAMLNGLVDNAVAASAKAG